jgi:hypothetical protein
MKVDVGMVIFTRVIHFGNHAAEERLDVRDPKSPYGKRFRMSYDYELQALEVYDGKTDTLFVVKDAAIACFVPMSATAKQEKMRVMK